MSFNIGELKHPKTGHVRLEISNDDEFIKRIKEINKKIPGGAKEKMKLWKISRVGEGRVPAKIQRLIENEEAPSFKDFIAEQKAKKKAKNAA